MRCSAHALACSAHAMPMASHALLMRSHVLFFHIMPWPCLSRALSYLLTRPCLANALPCPAHALSCLAQVSLMPAHALLMPCHALLMASSGSENECAAPTLLPVLGRRCHKFCFSRSRTCFAMPALTLSVQPCRIAGSWYIHSAGLLPCLSRQSLGAKHSIIFSRPCSCRGGGHYGFLGVPSLG